MRNDRDNVIVSKTIDFSLPVIKYCEILDMIRKFVISKQLLRAATSFGANVFEAQNDESKAEFIHKMKIDAKEASETQYWLIICERSDNYCLDINLKTELDIIIKILSKIISSSKQIGKLNDCIPFSNFQINTLTH